MAEDVRSSAPGEFGSLRLASAGLAFDDTEVEVDTLAEGDVIIHYWVEVVTGFDGSASLTVGDGTDVDKYGASAAFTEATPGLYPAASEARGPFAAEAADGVLTMALTATAPTVGAARLYALIGSAPA